MIHHIEIYVSDLKRSRIFYEFLLTNLGYTLYQEWEEGFSMALYDSKSLALKENLEPLMQFERSENSNPLSKAEQYLVFVQTPQDFLEAGYHRCRTGLNHLAFHAGTPDEIDQWRQEFLARGVKLLYDDHYPHAEGPDHYALYLEDPDRIKIELVGEIRWTLK